MEKFIKIAQSLADLYDMEIMRLDIKYNSIYGSMLAYLDIGNHVNDTVLHSFEIRSDGSFSCLD